MSDTFIRVYLYSLPVVWLLFVYLYMWQSFHVLSDTPPADRGEGSDWVIVLLCTAPCCALLWPFIFSVWLLGGGLSALGRACVWLFGPAATPPEPRVQVRMQLPPPRPPVPPEPPRPRRKPSLRVLK